MLRLLDFFTATPRRNPFGGYQSLFSRLAFLGCLLGIGWAVGGVIVGYAQTSDLLFSDQKVITTAVNDARSVHVADFDGDESVDVLSASFGDDKIAWYRNLGDGSFSEQKVITSSADGATSTYAADLTGDGTPDVLSASGSGDRVAWFENNGDGTFSDRKDLANNIDVPYDVHAADLNGNGRKDVLSISGDGIGWYKNEGDGNFSNRKVITASRGESIHTSDLDEDGDKDVLSSSPLVDVISWYENEEDEAFSEQKIISASEDGTESVYSADINNDNKEDFLFSARYDDKVAWYVNEGQGTFSGENVITTNAEGVKSVNAVDLTGDENTDVLSASGSMDNVSWYENKEGGEFSDKKVITTNAGGAESVFAADLTGDGKKDVLSASNDEIAWYRNQGRDDDQEEPAISVTSLRPESGVPGTQVRIYGKGFDTTVDDNTVTIGGIVSPLDSAKSNVIYARVPDGVDGGRQTVKASNGENTTESTQRLTVLTGAGVLNSIDTDLTEMDGPTDWGDMDGDGDLDLVVTGRNTEGNPTTKIYENTDDGAFTPVEAGLTGVRSGSADWGDFDRDGDLDLAITGHTGDGRTATIYENQGDGSFSSIGAELLGVAESASDWGDFDKDGDLDIIVVGNDEPLSKTAVIYENKAEGFAPVGARIGGGENTVDWGDFDADGDLDLIIGKSPISSAIYENKNEGFEKLSKKTAGYSVEWGDFDGDGKIDIIVSGANGDDQVTQLHKNKGKGNFDKVNSEFKDFNGDVGSSVHSTWGDYDADGDLDLAISGPGKNFNPQSTIYENEGNGNFAPDDEVDLKGVSGPSFAKWGDFNQDGRLDLIITGDQSKSILESNPSLEIYKSGDGSPNPSDLRVNRINPESGAPDAQLRIRGSGFSAAASENTVLLDSTTTATVDSASSNVLYARVPTGLPDGPVSVQVQTGGETVAAAQRFTVLSPERGGGPFDDLDPSITQISGLTQADAAWADYDQDGDLDLAVTGQNADGNPATLIYENDTGEGFGGEDKFVPLEAGLTDLRNGAVSWGDVDGDGRPDLAVSGTDGSSPVTKVYLNEGEDTFTELGEDLTGLRTGDLEWGDVNGDGRLDLLANGLDGALEDATARTLVYANREDTTAGGTVKLDTLGAELTGLGFSDADWGDMDGDGDLDLVLSGRTGSSIDTDAAPSTTIYENQGDTDGDGKTDFQSVGADVEDLENSSVEWGDYDQNGDLDLLVTGRDDAGDARSLVYENRGDTDGDGTPNFQSPGAGLAGVESGRGTWGDYDGDSDLDALVSGETSEGSLSAAIYENTGGGSFEPAESSLNGIDSGTAVWTDYDSDGALDVFEMGEGTGGAPTATLYDNGTPAPPTKLTSGLETVEDTSDFPVDNPRALGVDWSYSNELALQRYNIYRSREPISQSSVPSEVERTDTASTGRFGPYLDPDAEPGQTYYYRVTAVSRDGTESSFSEQVRFFWYPETVSTQAERTFGSGKNPSDYRLIAVPGQSPDPEFSPRTFPRVLPDTASWRAFRDDGTGPYEEYDQSEDFYLRPGRGFWVLSTTRWTGTGNVWETVELQGDTAAVVDLHDGWNIISNPTDKDISWDRVETVNNLSETGLFSFDGTYAQEDVMRSAQTGTAYYFLNSEGEEEELLLPYLGSPAYPDTSSKQDKVAKDAPTLALQAAHAEAGTSRVQIQFADDAKPGADPLDVVAPTSRFSALSLRLENPSSDHKPRQGYLATERRPRLGKGQTFDLTLRSRREEPIQILRKHIKGLSGAQVSLIVPAEERSHDLREEKSVTLNTGRDTTQLRLAIGSSEYVKNETQSTTPEEVRLQTYPNPVGQQATLQYALPEESSVRISVYDVLGRQVAQVVDRKQQAGRYTTTVDAGQLSSGVYFVRMRASGTTKTRKITVVR